MHGVVSCRHIQGSPPNGVIGGDWILVNVKHAQKQTLNVAPPKEHLFIY